MFPFRVFVLLRRIKGNTAIDYVSIVFYVHSKSEYYDLLICFRLQVSKQIGFSVD